MANYIPLQLDKDTGKTVATRRGLAIGNPASGFFRTIGFLFEQPSAVATWNIPHAASTLHFNVQVFDITGKEVFPDSIEIIDDENVTITFTAPLAGKAVFVFFEEPGN